MAYLHCHSCGWQQDDFYDEHYNPAISLSDWNDNLFGEKRHKLDKQFTDDAFFVKENGPITTREVIARAYEKYARRIRNIKWVTYEDFKNDPDKKCPECGSEDLDID